MIELLYSKLDGILVLRVAIGGIEIDCDERIEVAFKLIQTKRDHFFV